VSFPAPLARAVAGLFIHDRDGFDTIAELPRDVPSPPTEAVSGGVPIATTSALAATSHVSADRVLLELCTPRQPLPVVREQIEAAR
jgi:hypothetical protein